MPKGDRPDDLNDNKNYHLQVVPDVTRSRVVPLKERLKNRIGHEGEAREDTESGKERFIHRIYRDQIEANQEQARNERNREGEMITAIGDHQPPLRCLP